MDTGDGCLCFSDKVGRVFDLINKSCCLDRIEWPATFGGEKKPIFYFSNLKQRKNKCALHFKFIACPGN
jgi:hypothetical protein